MTRINCVPVSELTRAHLQGEYHELPRVFNLVRAAQARGQSALDYLNPTDKYTLGSGHVKFFYPRLMYLVKRYDQIVTEMRLRGYTVNFPNLPIHDLDAMWFNDWEPTREAVAVNWQRLRERDNYGD